jgi:hypothetical protein
MQDLDKWRAMIEAEGDEARRLGRLMVLFLVALSHYNGPAGCFPAIATVAAAAGVSIRTASEAILRAIALGYLIVLPGAYGWRRVGARVIWARSPNHYQFVLPAAAVPCQEAGRAWRKSWWGRIKARRATGRVSREESAKESNNKAASGAWTPLQAVDNSAKEALLKVRRQMEARMADRMLR